MHGHMNVKIFLKSRIKPRRPSVRVVGVHSVFKPTASHIQVRRIITLATYPNLHIRPILLSLF